MQNGRFAQTHRLCVIDIRLVRYGNMKSIIVGTAGHIDHGKTALVKALTGIDADRLKEEKQRGITIDIGFAHLELPDPKGTGIRLGFVDVPGHERFVRNMLAGIGGIDIVLLVVAADESIMPQTREHFDICRLLSVRRGITVLTKSDLVDRETLDVVRLEVEEYLRGSFLEFPKAPIIPVSSFTGAGLDDLKQSLLQATKDIPVKDSSQHARLPIDRVFIIKGFGTVVTGTLITGSIVKEEELELFPGGKRVRVRGVQVHNAKVERADAGQRTALNLAGIDAKDLARGMTLAPAGLFHATQSINVMLSLLPSARPLATHSRVHFYAHASEIVAEVILYSGKQLASGSSAYAQLRLADPTLLFPEDRFIIRQLSPVITIGGGIVLNTAVAPKRRKTSPEERTAFFDILQNGSNAEILMARIRRRRRNGINLAGIIAETGWRKEQTESALGQLNSRVIRFGDVLILESEAHQLKSEMLNIIKSYHEANPLFPGMARGELHEKLGLVPAIFNGVLGMLVKEKMIDTPGDLVKSAGRNIVMKDEESEAKTQIEQAFAHTGLRVPLLKDVLAGLKVDKVRAQKILYLLLREKTLIKVDDDIVFHRRAIDELRRRLAEYKISSSRITISQFKELAGVTRRYAMALLEYLDHERVTHRAGDERIIL
jgi:selenocysteine-specific elongation factor